MNVGVQLRVYRKSKGHSVQKVSEITGIPADRIYKWEKGTRPSDAEDLLKIKDYLAGRLENGQKELENPSSTPVFVGGTSQVLTGAHPTVQDHINEIKAHRAAAEAYASKLEAEKDRLYSIIETYLNSILANSVKHQDDLNLLKAQADIAIKQLARQDELMLRSKLPKSEAVKQGKAPNGK